MNEIIPKTIRTCSELKFCLSFSVYNPDSAAPSAMVPPNPGLSRKEVTAVNNHNFCLGAPLRCFHS
jgi:hypothetical protein